MQRFDSAKMGICENFLLLLVKCCFLGVYLWEIGNIMLILLCNLLIVGCLGLLNCFGVLKQYLIASVYSHHGLGLLNCFGVLKRDASCI